MRTVSIKRMLCVLFSVVLVLGLTPSTLYAQSSSDDEANEGIQTLADEESDDSSSADTDGASKSSKSSGSDGSDSGSASKTDRSGDSDSVSNGKAENEKKDAKDKDADSEKDTDEEATDTATSTLSYEGKDCSITVEYGSDANLPDDVTLSVSEYDKSSDVYSQSLKEATEICDQEEATDDGESALYDARLFDISLVSDGTEIEPDAAVSVTISYPNREESKDYSVIHFGKETEEVSAESNFADDTQTVSFDLSSFSNIMTLAYEGTAYDVVFTTSNDNGLITSTSGDSGGYNGGNRATVSSGDLADYADTDGTIEISLPANNDLGSTYTIYTDEDTDNTVTVTLSDIKSNYNYDLAGWYNLGTGDYYEAGSTATINLSERNVFYADYYAATYDVGNDNGNLANSVSTDFVDINLFDYNELFNLYSTDVTSGANNAGEIFTDSEYFYTEPAVLDDAEHAGDATESSSFITKYNNVGIYGADDPNNTQANIFYPGGLKGWNEWTDQYNLKDASDVWGIKSSNYADNPILNTLFNPDTDALGVKYIGDADYLFQYGTEDNDAPEEYWGYYYYSSNLNSAAYNQSDERFYVYNDKEEYGDSNMFLPFQDHDSYQTNGTGDRDLNVNYLFGMSMEVNFYLPNAVNGDTADTDGVGNKDSYGNDLVFNYSGDDDILVFVDDDLVLDMSGIHLEADGSINFNTGTWEMSNVTDGPTGNIDLSAGNHKLTVYYMERGTGYSNLTVSFNVVPKWYYDTGDVQTIEADKVWVDADQNVIEDTSDLPDVDVGLFAALGDEEQQGDGSYQFTDDRNQVHTFTYSDDGYTHSIDGKEVEASTTKNDEGQFVDENDWALAWMDDGVLYARVDVESLGESNGWKYDWEMRNPDESYVVLELGTDGYTLVKTETDDSVTHHYWSIIGETEIEDDLANEDLSKVKLVLTDGAQQTSETLGDTLEATGWVLVANTDGSISAGNVTFSQIGTMSHENPATHEEGADWHGTYGVTTESEISQYGDGAIWYMEDAKDKQGDTTGEEIEAFYLYCTIDGTTYYLTLSGDTLGVSSTDKTEFYYDSLGELRIVRADDGPTRVAIDGEGNITLESAAEEAEINDIRIYTLTNMTTAGNAYTFTNLLPDEPTKNVDVGNRTKVGVGDELTYTVAFFNDNDDAATVTITDVLDEGLNFVSATDGGTYDEDTRTITWVLEGVEALSRGSVQFTAKVNDSALEKGKVENTASVQIGNNSAVDTNTVENPVGEDTDNPNPDNPNGNNPNSGGNNPNSGGDNPNSGGNNPNSGGDNPNSGGNNPNSGAGDNGTGSAKTGDTTPFLALLALAIVAAAIAAVAGTRAYRNRHHGSHLS